MYSVRGNIILAFHGCDQSVCQKIVNDPKSSLKESRNNYDWLGHGMYFWENNPARALEYANFLRDNPGRSNNPINKPAVLGAVINLGYCLDLVDSQSLQILKIGYEILKMTKEKSEFEALQNKAGKDSKELLLRYLDCAVIETICEYQENKTERKFDSVRGVFLEGQEIYPNAGFRDKNHMQIAIRNPNCVKGYFLPRKEDFNFLVP